MAREHHEIDRDWTLRDKEDIQHSAWFQAEIGWPKQSDLTEAFLFAALARACRELDERDRKAQGGVR